MPLQLGLCQIHFFSYEPQFLARKHLLFRDQECADRPVQFVVVLDAYTFRYGGLFSSPL
jgi:hypothetical protein